MSAPRTILVIDDDQVLCRTLEEALTTRKVTVLSAHTAREGLALCARKPVDVVLLDQKLPDGKGESLCRSILKHNETSKIIFITAYPSFDHALQAIKGGACDYLSKPFELEEVRLAVDRSLRGRELETVEALDRYRTVKDSEENTLVGDGLGEVRKLVASAAASPDAPVLITGETGTGKNAVAKAIHYQSRTRQNPFVSVNCAALPEPLMEAELFGHEQGAFTGAGASKRGLFEMAEGGTLLLDEIGEMSPAMQSKLLGVIEERTVRRVGGVFGRPVVVRILAATNSDIEKALGKTFRRDLYYRLSVLHIHLPPLRERRKDIPELCEHLLKRIPGGSALTLPREEPTALMAYDWPGNVRELRNILERAVILQREGPVLPSELLGKAVFPKTPEPGAEALLPLRDVEKQHIQYVLSRQAYNLTRASKILGIALSTLKRYVKHHGLTSTI